MPRFPQPASAVSNMKGSVYSALAHRLSQRSGNVYPLHVGDTWMEPAASCRMEALDVGTHPGMHKYVNPRGYGPLVEAICRRTTARCGLETTPDEVLVTAGATHGLGVVLASILEPGDEVLIMAPFWPLIGGITTSLNGHPVPVPIMGTVESAEEAVAAFEARRTDRTIAVYVNTPNNPTGQLVPREWLERLAEWAREHDLWILSDEVYEDYVYEGEHVYCRPLAPERTFSAYSFSKAFGMAGNRCGYLVGPAEMMPYLRKIGTHTIYSAPTASQIAAARVLGPEGDQWVANARERYAELGRYAADRLGVTRPAGSTFLFVDVADALDEGGLLGFLERCVDAGLLVAPGSSFGPYPTHVRVCFTSAAPDVVREGIEVLAGLLGR